MLGLVTFTDVFDVVQGKVEDGDLDEAGKGGGDDLGHEHGARGDLHVVAELEVADKGEGLGHGYVAVGLEEHEGQGAAGLDVAVDELGQHVEADLVVGDGLDDADGQREGKGDGDGQQEGPPGQVGGIGEDGGEAEAEHLWDNS